MYSDQETSDTDEQPITTAYCDEPRLRPRKTPKRRVVTYYGKEG